MAGILALSWGCNIRQSDLGENPTVVSTDSLSVQEITDIVEEPVLEPVIIPEEPKPVLGGIPVVVSPEPLSKRQRVVLTAIQEIGTREEGGNNRGPRIAQYLATTGLGEGHPWCAAFTKFLFDQNEIPTPGATAWSPSWFPSSRTYWNRGMETSEIRKADTFGLYYQKLGRIGHVGLIEKIENGWLYTIEGNTGDDQGRDGDVVRRHRRSIKTIYRISNWVGE